MTSQEDQPREPQAKAKHRWVRDWQFQMGAIMLLALIPRLLYLLQIRGWHFFYYPILDSRTQYKWATILVGTLGLGNPEVLAKAPLYPYFLALNQWVIGQGPSSLFSARLVQLILGAVTCGMIYLLGRRVFGETVGIAAGVMAVLYSPSLFREGQLLDTALTMFLATSFLLALAAALEEPSGGRWFGAGLLLGLLGLARPNLLLLGPVMAALLVGLFRRGRPAREVAGMVGALALGVVLPILPITGRNLLISPGLVPISRTGGVNFYTGNNPNSDGYSPIPSGIAWERTWYQASMATGEFTSRSQDAYWRAQAVRFWREQPARALALLAKKFYLYWNAYEIPNNVSYEWGRAHSSVLRTVPLTFAIVGPLGLLGIALAARRSRREQVANGSGPTRPDTTSAASLALALFVGTNMVAVASFFVCGRYRMPAIPALCVFGGFALATAARSAVTREWSLIALSGAGLVVFGLLVNWDAYGVRRKRGANRDWYYLGQSYTLAADHERAKEAFRRATEDNPQDADAYALLGHLEMRTGEPEAAARDMIRSLDIAPDFATSAARLGKLYIERGWPLDEAERLLGRAVERQPWHVSGLATLTRMQMRQGELGKARENLERAAAIVAGANRSDTRWQQMAGEVQLATAEAREFGLEVPEALAPLR